MHACRSTLEDPTILCAQCVRACNEIQGQFVFANAGRGHGARLEWAGAAFADSGCVSCGACAAVCPTGAIVDADREREASLARDGASPGAAAARAVRTTCGYCGVGCQLDVHVVGDDVVRVEGGASPVNHGHLCVKGRYAHAHARHADRLRSPLMRRNGRLVEASWEEAFAAVASGLKRLEGRVAGLSSSRCTNEENYLFQKWMRGGLGTNDVDCCARVCHAPSAAGMREAFGTGAATNGLGDIDRADLLMVVGANVTEAHPIVGARIRQRVLRGVPLVVIDPRRTEIAALADVHLRPRPGTNVPLLNALASVLVEEGLVDRDFIARRAQGVEEFVGWIRPHTPERWEGVTGVPADRVRAAARLYGAAARPMMLHGLGVTEHFQGSEAVMLLCNLAILTGALGRPGVGINPLRGQNNVQGAADMGCQPDLLTGYARVDDAAARARFAGVWGRPLPEKPGRTIPRIYEAIRSGAIRGLFIMGEDVVQTDPDAHRVRADLARLELLVVEEIFLSETARLAHVVLPGASALEKDGTFTNGERRIQRVRAALSPVPGSRPDWQILCALMEATGFPQGFRAPAEVMDEIARVAPIYAGVSYARLDGEGLQWPVSSPEHPGTPILHVESFPVGRARLSRVDYIPSPGAARAAAGWVRRPGEPERLTLVTGRVLEHYNTGTMTRRGDTVRLSPADRLEIHPADAAARGIGEGDRVAVASAHGEATAVAHLTERVAAGVVFLSFHFPETGTNAVTGDVVDRLSDCPEYKLTEVEVRRS